MKSIRSLIFADAVIKLVLGVLLIVFPNSVVTFLGLPPADPSFYPSVLGAVLFGIGIAFSLRGTVVLWFLVLVLVGISAFEALTQSRH
jgi:hypothetical protein